MEHGAATLIGAAAALAAVIAVTAISPGRDADAYARRRGSPWPRSWGRWR